MLETVQYRSVIRFLFLQGKTRNEVWNELKAVYQEDCPSWATVKRWFNEFQSGRTSVLDNERPGRPVEIDEDKAIKDLEEIVKEERRITTRQLTTRLNVSKGTLHSLLRSCGIRKLCSRFVPRFLTAEMMSRRLSCCQENLERYEELGDQFLKNIITMDETPLSLYLPETKRESQEWKLPGEAGSRKLRTSTCHKRASMLSAFWDDNGILLLDFAGAETKINSNYYCNLVQQVRKKRRKSRVCELFFLADNAPIHTSQQSSTTVAASGLTVLSHPPYSPDLAPSDFFLFRHLKQALRGRRFDSKEELKDEVEGFFGEKSSDFFKNAFQELVVRWRKCVAADGGYIEK